MRQRQASQLLHNKFVLILGGSVQRSMYKDLVLLLQKENYLSVSQLKTKGELSFEHDHLVEGGQLCPRSNSTEYREVRQFRSDHHLVRFYFLTRVFSSYVESILDDYQSGLKPDILIVNSCIWDISRYERAWVPQYKENLHRFFEQIKATMPPECLVIWLLTMPLGKKIVGGFLVPEIAHMARTLRKDVIHANFYSSRLADAYGFDVFDLHFQFRHRLEHREADGIHWNALAHRHITCLVLEHVAWAWGVESRPAPPVHREDRRGYDDRQPIRSSWPHHNVPQDLVSGGNTMAPRDVATFNFGRRVTPPLTEHSQVHRRQMSPPGCFHPRPLSPQNQHINRRPFPGFLSAERLSDGRPRPNPRGYQPQRTRDLCRQQVDLRTIMCELTAPPDAGTLPHSQSDAAHSRHARGAEQRVEPDWYQGDAEEQYTVHRGSPVQHHQALSTVNWHPLHHTRQHPGGGFRDGDWAPQRRSTPSHSRPFVRSPRTSGVTVHLYHRQRNDLMPCYNGFER
ncbi:hypothetical protein UPYG_G00242690 [Umbra pygmaea]|uniref:PC-esterase domain-containing protein 1A n=1 Tax=Umbra pygmaea TaxID=75934 RepID=A0ABD0WFN1_UMBPY